VSTAVAVLARATTWSPWVNAPLCGVEDFAMEALVQPGGGPPPHIHTRQDETFYLLEGQVEFLVGEETIVAGAGEFVNIPRGTCTASRTPAPRRRGWCSLSRPPAIEHWFEETLEPAPNDIDVEDVPDDVGEVAARYDAAARYGIEFV
jgi:hypothetical protein